jgi:hypothetical protein
MTTSTQARPTGAPLPDDAAGGPLVHLSAAHDIRACAGVDERCDATSMNLQADAAWLTTSPGRWWHTEVVGVPPSPPDRRRISPS